ncbi:MAG: DUF4906 domain-containing protein [Bacteroidales bacterium]|nr:DUF4906 domain-containing protein [Bacteroidales bacterium]
MKSMRLYYIFSIVFMLFLSGCERDEMEINNTDGEGINGSLLVSVPYSFNVLPFGANDDSLKVKATNYSSKEMMIRDFWLIQFAENGDLLASTYHSPGNDAPKDTDGFPLLVSEYVQMNNDNNNIVNTKTVWIVANTGDDAGLLKEILEKQLDTYRSSFNAPSITDLQAFENDGYKFTTDSESSISRLNREDGAVLMSGKCDFDATDLYNPYPNGTPDYNEDNNGLEVTLAPIVAKLTINYEVSSDVGIVKNIKLLRIPSKVSYNPDNIESTDYSQVIYDVSLMMHSSVSPITVYIPQNKQNFCAVADNAAKPSSYTGQSKTEFAPPKATYVSFEIYKEDADRLYSANIFPGGDDDGSIDVYSNYNINANTHYTENILLNNTITVENYLKDSNDEPRLIEILKEDITSNCYILNPLLISDYSDDPMSKENYINAALYREECYALPIVQRVNEGWHTAPIGESTEWMVEVIWQDVPGRQIFFAESSGLKDWKNVDGRLVYENNLSNDNVNYATRYFGKGNGDNGYVYIYVKKETHSVRTAGNVLIGLKLKDANGNWESGYKWSWHLWVTDYNPDFAGDWNSGYLSAVPGDADNDGTRDAKVFHYKFWGSNTYSWIMDRHLGALGWKPMNVEGGNDFSSFGLYYQWGRKDPFPAQRLLNHSSTINDIQLYNIRGNATDSDVDIMSIQSNTSETGDIWKATNFPYVLYGVDLISTYSSLGLNWNHPGDSAPRQGSKSIFDPCPVGWEVPETEAYAGMVTSFNGTTVNSNNSNSDYTFFNKGLTENEEDLPQLQINDGAWIVDASGTVAGNHYSYFPCSGWLGAGGTKDMQGIGDIWCADQKSATLGSFLYIGYGVEVENNHFTRTGKTPAIVLKAGGENTTYFNKRNGFSVRCVKKLQ